MGQPANILVRLRNAELYGAGQRARSLQSLPLRFVAGIDSDGVRDSLARVGMGSLVLQLETLLRSEEASSGATTDTRELISLLCARVCESAQQRDVFVSCQGDVHVVQLLHRLAAGLDRHEAGPRRDCRVAVLNECIQMLAELAITDLQQAEALASQQPLLATLFTLMGNRATVDASLTLAQELLSVGRDVFPLSAVPNLPRLIAGLSPRGLSLVGRALAVLLAKSAEATIAGVPAPDCAPPDLCDSCANNAALLAMPTLLERIVALLSLKAPPDGLWGHMLAQLPGSPVLLAEADAEADWGALRESPLPEMVLLLSPQQVPHVTGGGPPALVESAAIDAAVAAAAAALGEVQAPQTADAQATVGFPPVAGVVPPMGADGAVPGALHLASLQAALWSTLQADLLYVVWALMGGKTKQEAQRQLISLGLLPTIGGMLERLDWTSTAVHHHGSHGAGCSCSPQSCLQMQLLRTLQAICEKESDAVSYHRMLLLPDAAAPPPSGSTADQGRGDGGEGGEAGEPEAKGPSDGAGTRLIAKGLPGSNAMGLPGISSREMRGMTEPVSSDRLGHAASTDSRQSHGQAEVDSASGSGDARPAVAPAQTALALAAASMPTPARAAPGSILHSLLSLLLCQPAGSVYTLGLASCVHKWVQASTPAEQLLVAAHPGLLDYVLDQLLTPEPPAEPHLQVFCDLLAELVKFNPVLLDRLQRNLAGQPAASDEGGGPGTSGNDHWGVAHSDVSARARLFMSRLLECPVDASILVQCVALTLSPKASPLRGMPALATLGLAPPEPFAAAAAGMPPPPADALPHRGPLAGASRGCIARMVRDRRVAIVRSLMCAVDVSHVSVETMCVINAAIVFFLLADCEGRRIELLDAVCASGGSGDNQAWPVAPAAAGRRAVPLAPSVRDSLRNFSKLLAFWGEVYHSHSCERKFLEFSSGVPFGTWQAVVGALKRDLHDQLEGAAPALGERAESDAGSGSVPAPAPASGAPCRASASECADGCACGAVALGVGLGQMGLCT